MLCENNPEGGMRTDQQPCAGLTGVDELHVSLQVAVDHEHLVAARMRAGSLPHLLVMLFDVLLKGRPTRKRKPVIYTD